MSVVYDEGLGPEPQQPMVAPAVVEEMTPPVEPEQEGVDVAGPGRIAGAASRFIQRNTPGFGESANVTTRPGNSVSDAAAGQAVETLQSTGTMPLAVIDKGDILTRPATAEEMAELTKFREDGADLPGMDVILPNLSRIGIGHNGAPPDQTLSASDLSVEELDLRRLITATFDAYKDTVASSGQRILRKGDRGFADIIADADQIGSVDIFLDLMNRKPGDRPFKDSELLAARRTIVALQMETMRLVNTAKETGDPLDKARAAQAFALEGYASIQLVGIQEDLGRILVSNKIISSPSKERTDAMRSVLESQGANPGGTALIDATNVQQFMDANGGEAAIDFMLQVYSDLPTDISRHEFARRGILRRGSDMLVEIYQSALLSNPLTHSYNAASTLVMLESLMIERFLEGRPKEAMAMLTAQAKYIPQALRAGWSALRTEGVVSGTQTKMDVNMRAVSRQGAGLRNAEEGGGRGESAAASFFDGLGISMRMFGFRPMLAMDETFKALGRGMQMEALAVRAQSERYRAGIKAGETSEVAHRESAAVHLRTLHADSTFVQAESFAQMATFQDDLTGVMAEAQGLFSHPIMKIWVPFYKTPTQVMRRIMERTPMGFAMPSVLRDKLIKGTNADRREALARIGTGSAVFATLMYTGTGGVSDNFTMTGYGPTDAKQRRTWLQNHEPYSVGIRKEDGTFDWISYARYDPFSGILAASMDTAEVLQYSDDTDTVDNLMLNGAIAVTRYVGTALPMLQFVGELVDVAGSPYEEHNSKMNRIRQLMTKQAASAALITTQQIVTAGIGSQGMLATFERYVDPTARDSRPENQYDRVPGVGLQPEIRGIYEALQYVRSRTPGLSQDLPPKRNRWFEIQMQGPQDGNAWRMITPMRVINKPGANIINKELNRLKLGFKNLPNSMGESMLRLNGEQYERYIELYNFPANSKYAKELFGDNVDKHPPNVLASMLEFISPRGEQNEDYKNLVPGKQIEILNGVNGTYMTIAKQLMLLEFDDLRAQVDKVKGYKDYRGRNPKSIGPATDGQIEAAGRKSQTLVKPSTMNELLGR